MSEYTSWGRAVPANHKVVRLDWASGDIIPKGNDKLLAFGMGRSYGDSCLNDGGVLLDASGLCRFLSFDRKTGVISCEAGVTLEHVLDLCVAAGWFLPVTPGTKYVTLAGAIANDVHGKNHHCSGTFGNHILGFELLRSDGERLWCSPHKNTELFNATIGGLGLTGLILRVDLQLRKVAGPFIEMESIKFGCLDEFFDISSESDKDNEYTVAWLDCTARGAGFGRGIFMRGNHSDKAGSLTECAVKKPKLSVPCEAPSWALNPLTVRAFNIAYYGKQRKRLVRQTTHYDPFFYPLDGVSAWNRIYGRRGLYQFQCVVPTAEGNRAIRELMRRVVESQRASFLAVIKEFGDSESPGMLSFPRKGITVCLDFPNQGERTVKWLAEFEGIAHEHGGALYPAKDSCMSRQGFSEYYPNWKEFSEYIDPRFSSSFWRRVTGELRTGD